jgi:hypothetical protein
VAGRATARSLMRCDVREKFACWWWLRRAWNGLPWPARLGVLRQGYAGKWQPDRGIALTSLGWGGRVLAVPGWLAICGAALTRVGAAGLLTAAFDSVIRGRGDIHLAVGAAVMNFAYAGVALPLRRRSAPRVVVANEAALLPTWSAELGPGRLPTVDISLFVLGLRLDMMTRIASIELSLVHVVTVDEVSSETISGDPRRRPW